VTAPNLVSYAAQVTILVLACAGLPRLLGLRSPGLQYAFWRTLLAACLVLPIVEPWRHDVMVFVPAPGPTLLSATGSAPTPPGTFTIDWSIAGEGVLVAGIVARLAWLGLGIFRLRRLRRRAIDHAGAFGDLQQMIGVEAPILWSPDARHPVTFGMIDPIILLPAALQSTDTAVQRAVVAHELHHVKRRDWAWVLGEEIVRSIFWFHPAIWWLISRLQLARETVVDELSILTTNARRAYLDTLLAFADDPGLASTAAFSARRHLFHRVMLLSREGEMSSLRIAVGSCVLIFALGAATLGAARAFPLTAVARVTEQNAARDALTPEVYVRRAAEALERALKDTSLTRDEKMEVLRTGIVEADRALSIDPRYVSALVYKNVLLRMSANMTEHPEARAAMIREADELRDKAMVLQRAAGQTTAVPQTRSTPGFLPPPPLPRKEMPAPPPPPQAPATEESFQVLMDRLQPERIAGRVKQPEKIRDVKPVYPPEAKAANVQGVVIVEALIDSEGMVAGARVLRSIPMLDEAALKAVSQWRFAPTLLDNQPTAVLMTVTVNFRLE